MGEGEETFLASQPAKVNAQWTEMDATSWNPRVGRGSSHVPTVPCLV